MTYLPTFDDVMEIHEVLVEMFVNDDDPVSPAGARDVNLVHSACLRPHTGIGESDKYPDEYAKLAALFHSLVQNHGFHNGNKRTALVTLLASLYQNGRILDYKVTDDELYELTRSVADGLFLNRTDRVSADEIVDLIAHWLRKNSVARNISPSDMKTADFLERCASLGCNVRDYDGGKLISFDGNSIRIGADTRQFSGKIAKRYLGTLGLTYEKTGQTFAEFQNVDEEAEREQIYRYMSVLRRLAKI
ncbi:death-on-curing family protein [Defluviimonas denitrificans]|jgi:death-on-curing family protein|uniref:Death-on-curing family protein n=1 Tax=Albidovulum denitrificans TaxID=404881 RepID=A0A2S8S8I9_9RHOB|nr:type II toxin-antitoxin system death-on-curing family toxin [Defluviimonas denitrificans]PQV57079.1 death-on-curing family protein [Defluviimonas denitrificans]